MDIQQLIPSHITVVGIDTTTGLIVSDHVVGYRPISTHRFFLRKAKLSLENVGKFLLGGSLYKTRSPLPGLDNSLLEYLLLECLVEYQGKTYALDIITYLDLDTDVLYRLTALEYLHQLSQADVDTLLAKIAVVLDAKLPSNLDK